MYKITSLSAKLLTVTVLSVSMTMNFAAANESDGDNEDSNEFEKVMVSSTRRDAFVSEISTSISALTEKELLRNGTDSLEEVSRQIAGMSFSQPVKNRGTISIRGMNTDIGETQLTQDPVGLFVNDMPLIGTYAEIVQPDMSLYDINRVEVIKGPQGTLFGSGSIGGVVRIITNQANLTDVSGSMRLDLADTKEGEGRTRLDAMFNLPLIKDELALRIVGSVRDDNGWTENTQLNLSNSFKDSNFRASVLWQPNEDLVIRFDAMRLESDPDDGSAVSPDLERNQRRSVIAEGRPFDMQVYHISGEFQLSEDLALVSSTNIRKSSADWLADLGPFGDLGDLVNQSGPLDSDNFVQEFRLQSSPQSEFDWVSGIYFYDTELTGPFLLNVLGLKGFADMIAPEAITNELFFGAQLRSTMKEVSVFGDVTIPVNKRWSVSAGARYFDTESSYTQFDQFTFDFDAFSVIDIPSYLNEVEDNGIMWRMVLAFKPNNTKHYYASASKGARSAQPNPNFGPSFADPDDVFIEAGYQQDQVYSYELGAKLTFLDSALQTNIAMYLNHWKNVQVDALRLSDTSNYIANAGDAKTSGLELELRAFPNDQFNGYINATWQSSKISKISREQSLLSGALEGDELPGSPDFQFNAGVEYSWRLTGTDFLAIKADFHYQGESVNRFSNLSGMAIENPDFAQNQAFSVVNANLSYLAEDWQVSLYIDNLQDKDTAILNVGQSLANSLIRLRPRTIGLRIYFTF